MYIKFHIHGVSFKNFTFHKKNEVSLLKNLNKDNILYKKKVLTYLCTIILI